MTYYNAKFTRESKKTPTDWVIAPTPRGFTLLYIGLPGNE